MDYSLTLEAIMGNGSSHNRGYAGEQSMGFFLGERGYFFVEGPSGAAGHGVTSPGFDGVAYNPTTQHLIIYDNKSFARSGNVSSATAIDPSRNLQQNLGNLIQRVNSMTNLPNRTEILNQLRRAQSAIQTGNNWPANVQIAVSNASGQSSGVSQRLSSRGIQFIDYTRTIRPSSPSQRRYVNAAALFGSLLGSLAQWIGDIGIQQQIRSRLENELRQAVSSLLMRGQGVLVIIRLQEWAIPDIQGRRARGLLGVHVQGGASQQAARQAWENTPRVLQGPPQGWRVATQYAWISPLM
jgi:hypothetical protein